MLLLLLSVIQAIFKKNCKSSPRPRRWPSCATRPTSARRRRTGRISERNH